MKRGDVVILNAGGNIGKPRPAVIMQADILNDHAELLTTIILPLTSDLLNMSIMRYKLEASGVNGLTNDSQVMIDKITQIEKNKIQKTIGQVSKKQMDDIEARLLAILGVK